FQHLQSRAILGCRHVIRRRELRAGERIPRSPHYAVGGAGSVLESMDLCLQGGPLLEIAFISFPIHVCDYAIFLRNFLLRHEKEQNAREGFPQCEVTQCATQASARRGKRPVQREQNAESVATVTKLVTTGRP